MNWGKWEKTLSNLKNKLIRLIEQSVKFFDLDLTGLNILVPSLNQEPDLTVLAAGLAGAKNIYVKGADNNSFSFSNIKSNITFINEESPKILSNIDIVLKGDGISHIGTEFVSALNKNSVISILPDNLDFYNIDGIDLNSCTEHELPVIRVNPDDPNLVLTRYFAHIILKKCYDAGIELFKSRILLAGNGELMEKTISLLKANGAHVLCGLYG